MNLEREQILLSTSKADEAADRILNLSFRARGLDFIDTRLRWPWDERLFGLHETSLWLNANDDVRAKILDECCDTVVAETFYIEVAGMSYAAKMNLLAASIEEKSYFSLMGAEEATHFEMLKPWYTQAVYQSRPSSFASLIGQIVAEADRRTCVFFIQILLEGWGLSYYQSLMQMSMDPLMRVTFEKILKDESRHHAAGTIFFEPRVLEDSPMVREFLSQLFGMVRVGPYSAASTTLKFCEVNDAKAIENLLMQMKADVNTQLKLNRLKMLVGKYLPATLLSFCEEQKLFQSCQIGEMVQILRQ